MIVVVIEPLTMTCCSTQLPDPSYRKLPVVVGLVGASCHTTSQRANSFETRRNTAELWSSESSEVWICHILHSVANTVLN